jgi:hypothetical protein
MQWLERFFSKQVDGLAAGVLACGERGVVSGVKRWFSSL